MKKKHQLKNFNNYFIMTNHMNKNCDVLVNNMLAIIFVCILKKQYIIQNLNKTKNVLLSYNVLFNTFE